MNVKPNHTLAEILAKKLFSIENVPKDEQIKMVRRAIKAAVEFYEKSRTPIVQQPLSGSAKAPPKFCPKCNYQMMRCGEDYLCTKCHHIESTGQNFR